VTKAGEGVNPDEVCRRLRWDSSFFERRIASVTVNRLTRASIQEIMRWCDAQGIDCLYFLADSNDPETVLLAESYNFHFVDIRVTLERKTDFLFPADPAEGLIRPYRESDLSCLREIARDSHRDSRFYSDKNFPEARCGALYEAWIDKSAHGDAGVVLVAVVREEAVGYIACESPPDGEPRIGLFAVAEHARGLGLGRALIAEGLRWFVQKGAARVTVVTQGRNIPAQRLYQRCGFVTRSVQLWYHHWRGSGPRSGE
jgi:dTDP-4-amino-4,6-dideoxy-D-galactose acyltransferase